MEKLTEQDNLAEALYDDLRPLLTPHLAEQIARLVINYGYRLNRRQAEKE